MVIIFFSCFLFFVFVTSRSCTNNSSWLDKILSLEAVPRQILEDLRIVKDNAELMSILGSSSDFSRDATMVKFLKNSIVLCLEVLPRNHILEQSLLDLEESLSTTNNSSSDLVNPSRGLAKSLLKKDRQVHNDFMSCNFCQKTNLLNLKKFVLIIFAIFADFHGRIFYSAVYMHKLRQPMVALILQERYLTWLCYPLKELQR